MLRYDLVISAYSPGLRSGPSSLNREIDELERIRRASEVAPRRAHHRLRNALLLAIGLGALLGVMQITQALTSVA